MSHRISITSGIAALGLVFAGGQATAQCTHGAGHPMTDANQEGSQTGHSHQMAMVHGGQVTMTPHHHFEVLFGDKQTRVYVYDDTQAPISDLEGVKGSMTLATKGGDSETVELHYLAPDPQKGQTQGYFYADHEMGAMPAAGMKATIKMTGLEQDPIEFRTPVTLSETLSYQCPMMDSAPAEDPGPCPKCGMQMTMMGHGGHMDHGMSEGSGRMHGDAHGSQHH